MSIANIETSNTEIKQTLKSKGKKAKSSKVDETPTIMISESEPEPISIENVELSDNIELSETDILVQGESNDECSDENSTESNELTYSNSEELLEHVKIIEASYQFLSDKNIKSYDITKDFFLSLTSSLKKTNKLSFNFNQSINDYIVKEQTQLIKKESKSLKKPKKKTDKDKFAVNIPQETYPEILTLMKLEPGTLVSKAMIMQYINAYVKNEKTNNNPDIFVQGDNRCFKLIGEIKELFTFIRTIMIKKGDLTEDSDFPTQLSYTSIMKYYGYCFPVKLSKK